jgi:hypothetical protein
MFQCLSGRKRPAIKAIGDDAERILPKDSTMQDKPDNGQLQPLQITDGFSPFPHFGHPVQQCVLPIVTIMNGYMTCIGSGFFINSNGLMMTAVHVIHEALKGSRSVQKEDGTVEHQLGFYALYISDEKHSETSEQRIGGLLPIDRVWFSEELDIGYCHVVKPTINGEPALRFRILRLSPGLPRVGESILGIGYHSMRGALTPNEGGTRDINYAQDTAFTTGIIKEVYPIRRDSAMLSFPSFLTDARFEPGMSGGPILNERGGVCGVVCSSNVLAEEHSGHISFGSLIWPALATCVDVIENTGAEPRMMMVYDLIKAGWIFCDETIAAVKIELCPNELSPNGKRVVHIDY